MTLGNMTAFQQQQLLAVHQQQLLAVHQQHLATVAQHHLAMAAAASNQPQSLSIVNGNLSSSSTTCQQQQDEISKSLKMFAMLTAYSNSNGM